MRAVVYHGNRKLEIEDIPEPKVGHGQVKVNVSRNGICGTDVHEYYDGPLFIPSATPHPMTGKSLPLVIGHEFSGTVTEVGGGVDAVQVGDEVTIEPTQRCERCRACRSGNYNLCASVAFLGLMADGGMAEYAVVPRNMVHRLPSSVSVEMGALVEPMAVAYHAAALGGVNDRSTALIYGAGPIGIGIWFALRGLGLTEIDVVETSASRRAAMRALGARTLDPGSQDIQAIVADQTHGLGVDAAYDAAGVGAAVQSALECLGEQRTMVCVATHDKPVPTSLLAVMLRERRIQGSVSFKAGDFEAVIDLMSKGYYDTNGWVETIPMSRVIENGFEELHAGRKTKLLVDPAL